MQIFMRYFYLPLINKHLLLYVIVVDCKEIGLNDQISSCRSKNDLMGSRRSVFPDARGTTTPPILPQNKKNLHGGWDGFADTK